MNTTTVELQKGHDDFIIADDDFEVVRQIIGNRNRFGPCWLVKDRAGQLMFKRHVIEGDPNDNKGTGRFTKQIDLLVRLKPHYAIAKFIGFQLQDENIFMEYIENESLEKMMERGAMTPDMKSKTIFGIACAMMHIHSHGAIHRYVKPSNILFDKNYEPKLVDFNYAKIVLPDVITQTNINNDPWLCAPEMIIDPTKYDEKIDVFAFGMIAYYILTGTKPYNDIKGIHQINEAIVNNQRPPLPANAGLLGNIITPCWAHSQDNRPFFYHIVHALLTNPDPLFPGTDEDDFSDYKLKVFDATFKNEEADEFFREVAGENQIDNNDEILRRADRGDANAQIIVGQNYEKGIGVAINYNLAYQYYKKAADQGNIQGCYHTGICLFKGRGIDMDQQAGVELIKNASDHHFLPAVYQYAIILKSGKVPNYPKNLHEAQDLFKEVADKDNKNAQFEYANLCYHGGEGIHKNDPEALAYYDRAGKNGLEEAICNYAYMKMNGEGCEADVEEGLRIYGQAADRGFPGAIVNLGLIYLNGKCGIRPDYLRAYQYFEHAHQLNFIKGKYYYGYMKVNGLGCEKSQEEGRELIKKAADSGDSIKVEARYYYGRLCELGVGGPQDFKNATKFFHNAAELGHEKAILGYARLHINNQALPPNKDVARQYLTKLIDKGNDQAHDMLNQLG